MPLTPGTRLGPFDIVAPLGEGGMGVVYRARDTRLDREVALKFLPDGFADDEDRQARFEREAKLLASLNQPNIAALFGLEHLDGKQALVMELVEGDELSALIGRGPLPLAEALAIAGQIAAALEAAHERGVVHRDLKPANVKVRGDGTVKVLDFGLAKGISLKHPSADPASTPTITSGGTLAGTAVGTPAYMSPEQARGREVDRRTDVWAFGCVLFEMLAGEKAFGGETAADSLARVIAGTPDWARLPARTPPAIRRLLRRCLKTDPRERLRDLGDARLELEEAAGEDVESAAASVARPAPEVRLARITDSVGLVSAPAVSPDGKMVAFVAVAGGRRQIWIRMLGGGVPLQVTRDDADHDEPRWMPDSSSLVYHTPVAGSDAGHVWQVSALGGPPRRVIASIGGADVSHDGRHLALFQRTADGTALAVAAMDGSGVRDVLTVPSEFRCDRPRWSPDDRLLAFQRAGIFFDNRLEVVDPAGGRAWTAVRAGWMQGHSWLPDGSGIVYSSSIGSTMPYPPTHNLRVVGHDGSADRQLTFGDVSYFEPDVHASGRIVASRVRSRSDVWRFPIDGSPAENVRDAVRVTRQTGQIHVPSVSPDGREIAYVSDSGGHSNLWLAGADGTGVRQLTYEREPGVTVGVPMWAPAGDRLVFVRAQGGHISLCLINPDGTGFRTLLADAFAPSWSADGLLLYCSRSVGTIERVDLATGAVVPVRNDRATGAASHPNGGVLFFARLPQLPFGVGGDTEVCRARPEDGPAEVLAKIPSSRVPLASTLRLHASASPDGRWLAFPLLDHSTANIWLVPTDGGPMRAVTDFGERSVFIARSVSWAPDSRQVYAAVADTDADIVVLDGVAL